MRLTQIGNASVGAITLVAQGISTAEANDIGCGSTIGPNETVALEEDIGPCNTGAQACALPLSRQEHPTEYPQTH